MKSLRLAVMLGVTLALFFCGYPDSRWRFFGKDTEHGWFYYDKDSVQKQPLAVKIWIRRVPMADVDQELPETGASDTQIFKKMAYREDVFPDNRDFVQYQWTLYADRTLKMFDPETQAWTDRQPIAPQTMVEGLWRKYFKK